MRRAAILILLLALNPPTPAQAEGWTRLGVGRLTTNDLFGDMYDRWRTGSGVVSVLFGRGGVTARPAQPGRMVEVRFAGGVVAPSRLRNPAPWDRRYAGYLSLGAHTHFAPGPFEASLGVDLVATGPQTQMSHLQTAIHDVIGAPGATGEVLAAQIPDAVFPTALGEMAVPFTIGDNVTLRPFVEAQAGFETFARIGADVLIGSAWSEGIWIRDTTSGQLYQSARHDRTPGVSVLVGADAAHVWNSALLPAGEAPAVGELRTRARAGVIVQGKRLSVFYGATWLGPEFVGQPEGQFVGTVRIDIAF